MTTAALTITYTRPDQAADHWLRLEQEPVTSNRLTATDMAVMLAMVASGTSAKAYRQPGCEAQVIGNRVVAELVVKVWPSSLALKYDLTGQLVSVGGQRSLREWHEFDLVLPMVAEIDLPYLPESATITWQTQAYNRFGEEVDPPAITRSGARLTLDTEVFGVLRVKCLAQGWRHVCTFEMAKSDAEAITSLRPTVNLQWAGGNEYLNLELPGCLEALLAMCPDGTTAREHALSTVDDDEDEAVPVVYYSPCSGRFIALRYEKP